MKFIKRHYSLSLTLLIIAGIGLYSHYFSPADKLTLFLRQHEDDFVVTNYKDELIYNREWSSEPVGIELSFDLRTPAALDIDVKSGCPRIYSMAPEGVVKRENIAQLPHYSFNYEMYRDIKPGSIRSFYQVGSTGSGASSIDSSGTYRYTHFRCKVNPIGLVEPIQSVLSGKTFCFSKYQGSEPFLADFDKDVWETEFKFAVIRSATIGEFVEGTVKSALAAMFVRYASISGDSIERWVLHPKTVVSYDIGNIFTGVIQKSQLFNNYGTWSVIYASVPSAPNDTIGSYHLCPVPSYNYSTRQFCYCRQKRLSVANGVGTLETLYNGKWQADSTVPSGQLKPGIYNIANSTTASKGRSITGVIVYIDDQFIYQQSGGDTYVVYERYHFSKLPAIGSIEEISY